MRQRRKREPQEGKKSARFPELSRVSYDELSASFSRVYSMSLGRARIYKDPEMYFVIGFSDDLSWKPIQDTIKNLEVSVVDLINERTVKVSLKKEQYQSFLYNLRKNHRYVKELRETALSEKLERPLIEELRDKPDQEGWFTFELSNLSGVEEPERIEKSVAEYLRSSNLGNIKRSYFSENLLILSGMLKYSAVEEIVNEIEAITKIFKMPKIELMTNELIPISLASMTPVISLSPETNQTIFPSICVIDSGINSSHKLLKEFIEDIYDYSTQDNRPCKDVDGHGSMVSGLAIYGEDLRRNKSPLAKVVMVKNFESGNIIERDLLKVIFESILRYRFSSNVFSFSFAQMDQILHLQRH